MHSSLRQIGKLMPAALRQSAGQHYRSWLLDRALRRFAADPRSALQPGDTTLAQIVEGWGNNWSAQMEYLHAIVDRALVTRGPILECGSGLTTLLLGVLAQQRGNVVWTLENSPLWGKRVSTALRRARIDAVRLHVAPLRDYSGFTWYDPPLAEMPNDFSLVICDGPPSTTPGGRFGLVPVMSAHLAAHCTILLDDGAREPERRIAAEWASTLGATVRLVGYEKPFFEITIRMAGSESLS